MKLKPLCLVIAAALLPVAALHAQDQNRDQFYGYQMMTPQEREQFHEKMGAAQTQEERDRIRAEHQAVMRERMGGAGAGPGGGMGGGMGRGR